MVYFYGGEVLWELVYEFEVGEEDVVVVLEEQGVFVVDVEGYLVGEFYLFEGGFFGYDFFDEGVEEGVGLQE